MSVNRVFRVEVVMVETGEVRGFYMVSSSISTIEEAQKRVALQFGPGRVLGVKKASMKT